MNLAKKNINISKVSQKITGFARINVRSILMIILSLFIFGSASIYGQKAKKNKARLNVQYVKIMGGEIYFDIKASSRVKKKNVKIPKIEIKIFNVLDDERISLGKVITNMEGESRFKLKSLHTIKSDSSKTYTILFTFDGNEVFKKSKKSISFKDAQLSARIISKDSLNFISAHLIDPYSGNPIVDEALTVQVQRLFKPLRIGEEFNNTDEDGKIKVPIESGIPGVNGDLTIEVVLNESDDYGTVIATTIGSIGVPITDQSTFDQRTMWSPRNKTPLFLLIFPNLLILGIWGLIIYLIVNLFKLSKS